MDGELLINEVFCRPPIWESKHVHHRNRGVIDKMCSEVATALSSTKDEVRSKWKNMRDTYRRELQKVKKTKSGDEGGIIKYSTWPFFDLLFFLKEEMQPSKTSGNLNNPLPGFDEQFTHSEHTEEEVTEEVEGSLEQINTSSNTSRSQTPTDISSKYVRKRKETVQEEVSRKMLQLEEEKVNILKSHTQEKFDDYHFLLSLLPHLKEFDGIEKLSVRNKITQVVIDAKLNKSGNSLQTFNYGDSLPGPSYGAPHGQWNN